MIYISYVLITAGTLFVLIAAIGVWRMPDLYMRMHAATKAGTLGATLVLSGIAVDFHQITVTIEVILTITFLVLSAPVASHLIGRAAWKLGEPFYKDTQFDTSYPVKQKD